MDKIDIEKFLVSLRSNKELDGKLNPICLADTVQEEIKIIQAAVENSRREWVGLTGEESKPLIQKAMMYYGHNPDHWTLTAGAGFYILARAIEDKLKEKNT